MFFFSLFVSLYFHVQSKPIHVFRFIINRVTQVILQISDTITSGETWCNVSIQWQCVYVFLFDVFYFTCFFTALVVSINKQLDNELISQEKRKKQLLVRETNDTRRERRKKEKAIGNVLMMEIIVWCLSGRKWMTLPYWAVKAAATARKDEEEEEETS